MPTMPTEIDPNGYTRYILDDQIAISHVSGENYRTITFNTSNFNICSKDIKYVCSFTSNLSSLNGKSIPDGTSNLLLNTTAGWWFPAKTNFANSPEITKDNLTYTVQPYTSGKSGIILRLRELKHTNSNITIKIPTGSFDIDRSGASVIGNVKVTPGWMIKGRAIIQATSASTGKYSSYTSREWTFNPHPSVENAYVKVCAYCNSYSTTTVQLGNSTYPDKAAVETVSVVTRYGTGSPGSPYSYSGSRSIRLKYRFNQASGWNYTSATTGISGSTGYSATDYISFWRVNNYFLPELDVNLS